MSCMPAPFDGYQTSLKRWEYDLEDNKDMYMTRARHQEKLGRYRADMQGLCHRPKE